MLSKCETKRWFLSGSYQGRKKLPDWFIEHQKKVCKGSGKHFWEDEVCITFDPQKDVVEHYHDDMSGYTGTWYNCHRQVIGHNNLVNFHLKSVLYHCPAAEKIHETLGVRDRLNALKEKVERDIDDISAKISAGIGDEEELAKRLSKLLPMSENVQKNLVKTRKKLKKHKSRSQDTAGNTLVLMIRMEPKRMLNKDRLLKILESVFVDEATIQSLKARHLGPSELRALDGCLNLYLPYRVQWDNPLIQEILFEKIELSAPTIYNIVNMPLPESAQVTRHMGPMLSRCDPIQIRREAIDDYKTKLRVEAQLREECEGFVFCPVQFFWANDLEIDIANQEFRLEHRQVTLR